MNKYYVERSNGHMEEVNSNSMYIESGALMFWTHTDDGLLKNLEAGYAPGEWRIVTQEPRNEA